MDTSPDIQKAQPPQPRVRRSNETRSAEMRAALIEAAIQSLCAIGYSKTTTHEICRRAGATSGAIQHHFGSKDELILATLQGRRPRSTALSVSAEPILLLAIGIVPGVLLSVPLAALGAHLWLRPGTPVHLTGTSVITALLVAAVAALVTILVAYVAAARPHQLFQHIA